MRSIVSACLILVCLAGCRGRAPLGYKEVEALIRPRGRSIAILPFQGNEARGLTPVDGIVLAEFATIELRKALPDLTVLGPSDLRDVLRNGMDESRWYDIGREAGADLLVIGEIPYLNIVDDKLVQSREGTIGLRFLVVDVTEFPPGAPTRVTWPVNVFPEAPGEKYDPFYRDMDAAQFRREVLGYGASRVASAFYDHFERKEVVERIHARVRKE